VAFGLAALAGVAVGEPREAAAAQTAYVRGEAGFAAAAARFRWSGGTIALLGARYESLYIGPRGTARLTVRAARSASVGHVRIDRARSVRLVGLRLTPRGANAGIETDRARNVRLERISVNGGRSGFKANVLLFDSSRVTIVRSRFTRCGDKAVCILTGRSSRVRILRSRFHDCFGCDFIRGNFGRSLVIRENRFDRSLVGPCGKNRKRCNHQEMIELHRGSRLFIERNRFGVFETPGAGQVALFGAVNDVRIRNNLFLRTDPRAPGLVARVGINLGGLGTYPKRVVISHNTILSGRRHWRGFTNSIRIGPNLAFLRLADRPVIANNVMWVARTPRFFCRGARLTAGNVIERGEGCSPQDVVGPANLNAAGRPTAASVNVIGRAVLRWATTRDMRRVRRDASPDAGAFEYVPPSGR
jgi:hypothetical protein